MALIVEGHTFGNVVGSPLGGRIGPIAFGQGADFGAAKACERLEDNWEIDLCDGAQQDKLARMIGIPCCVGLGHKTAESQAADDRFDNTESVAKPFHVVTPLFKIPGRRISSSAAAVAAVIVVDDMRYIA
jgi:hypothetical protein